MRNILGFFRNGKGVVMIERGLTGGLIAVLAIGASTAAGTDLTGKFIGAAAEIAQNFG